MTRANPTAAARPCSQDTALEESIPAVLAGDASAWRRLVRELAPQLRRAIRNALESPTEDQVEDVLSEFWLRVLENEMSLLRTFNRERGGDLGAWLKLHVYDTANQHLRQQLREPALVPLSESLAYDDPRQHVYVSRLLPADATERFVSALSSIYGRRLLAKLSEVASLPRATIDHD